MSAIVFIWEIALVGLLLVLLFMTQDWNEFEFFKKYIEKKQRKKDELAAEKLLDNLPQGVIRYKENEFLQK